MVAASLRAKAAKRTGPQQPGPVQRCVSPEPDGFAESETFGLGACAPRRRPQPRRRTASRPARVLLAHASSTLARTCVAADRSGQDGGTAARTLPTPHAGTLAGGKPPR